MTTIVLTMTNNHRWNPALFDQSTHQNNASLNFVEEIFPSSDVYFQVDHRDKTERMEAEKFSSSSSSEGEQDQVIVSPAQNLTSTNLLCVVCGVPANGYNFDQITCESCKAFFRRNALRNTPNLKCRFSGSCVINAHTRRLCTCCRLKKCFAVNMRKEWIRTDEERQLRALIKYNKEQRKLNKQAAVPIPALDLPMVVRKKKRRHVAPAVVQQDLARQPINPVNHLPLLAVHRDLCPNDQNILNNITHAYQSGAELADCSYINHYTSSKSLTDFINDESQMYTSLIHFYKNILDFKQFAVEDQILLIKGNLVGIIHLHHIIVENFRESPKIGAHMSKWIGPDFHHHMSQTRSRFDRFMNYPLVLKLSMIVFVFSMTLSSPPVTDNMSNYTNRKKIYVAQNMYTNLLWRYLNYLFDEVEATRSMTMIVMQILRYQTLVNILESVIHQQMRPDTLTPLMQSILRLT